MLLVIVMSPGIGMFIEGYGGFDIVAVFLISLSTLGIILALPVALGILVVRSIRSRDWQACLRVLGLTIVLTAIFSFTVIDAYTEKSLRASGAKARLWVEGGDAICSSLLKDAKDATSSAGSGRPIDKSEMPKSLRSIGGRFAYVYPGEDGYVDVWTCLPPAETGWILVPDGSTARPHCRPTSVEVVKGIYRY